jgi:hypothetical protein
VMELMEFAPDAVMAGTPHLPGTREYFSCVEGQVTIFVAGERFELRAGDVLGFPGECATFLSEYGERTGVGRLDRCAGEGGRLSGWKDPLAQLSNQRRG